MERSLTDVDIERPDCRLWLCALWLLNGSVRTCDCSQQPTGRDGLQWPHTMCAHVVLLLKDETQECCAQPVVPGPAVMLLLRLALHMCTGLGQGLGLTIQRHLQLDFVLPIITSHAVLLQLPDFPSPC